MKPNVPHRHHYVTQAALRRFTDDNGRVWVYDSERGKHWTCRPCAAGFETNFYARKLKSVTPEFAVLEKLLAEHIDGPGDDAISGLLQHQTLDGRRWCAFVGFVAAQMQRTPEALERVAALHAPVLQEMFQRMANYDHEFRGRVTDRLLSTGTPAEEIRKMFECIRDGGCTVKPARDFVLTQCFKMIDTVAALLLKMKWSFSDVPEGEPDLVIGDHPVTLSAPGSSAGLGLKNPAIEVLMPLSPRTVACATWDGQNMYGILAPGISEMINSRTLASAKRFVFARSKSEDLLAEVIRLRGSGPKMRAHRVAVGQGLMIVNEFK